jgi:hypothetical protein
MSRLAALLFMILSAGLFGWAGFWFALLVALVPNALVGWRLRRMVRGDTKFWKGLLVATDRQLKAMSPAERSAFRRRIEAAADSE